MALGIVYKNTRKAGAFVGGELAAGQIGIDVSTPAVYYSVNGTTVEEIVGGSGYTQEQIEDFVGAMLTGNTETGITVTYQDSDSTIDFEVGALNSLPAPTGDLSLNSNKITDLATPTADADAATKAYVDAASVGIDWKPSVRVATTTAGTLASDFENGDTVDGVVLSTGDRILIKDQSAGAENGIYVVAASGAPTRATDADTSAEVTGGMAVWVNEGTTNADTGWVVTTNDAITLGTTALVFAQFSGLGQVTAGDGLTKSGNTLNVVAGTGITANANSIEVNFSAVAAASHNHAGGDITSGDIASARMTTNLGAALNALGSVTITNNNIVLDGGTI